MIPVQIQCEEATRAHPDHTCAAACGDTDPGVSSSLSPSRPPPNQARPAPGHPDRRRSRSALPEGRLDSSRCHPGLRGRPHRCAVPHHPLLQGSDLNPSWRTATRIGPSMFAIPIARQVVRAPAGCDGGQPTFLGRAPSEKPPAALPARGESFRGRQCPGRHWGTLQAVPGLAWPDTQPWRWPSLAMVPHSGHTRCAQQAGSPPSPGSPAVAAAPVTGSEFRVGSP